MIHTMHGFDLHETPGVTRHPSLAPGDSLPIGSKVRAAFIYSALRKPHQEPIPLYIRITATVVGHSRHGALLQCHDTPAPTPFPQCLLGTLWDLIK